MLRIRGRTLRCLRRLLPGRSLTLDFPIVRNKVLDLHCGAPADLANRQFIDGIQCK